MKIIAGLGNPTPEYSQTKHNAGFMCIDALAKSLGVTNWQEKFNAQVAQVLMGGEKVLLMKPQTYMNNSGEAIAPALNWYKEAPQNLTVIYDDMDLPPGLVRIRTKGSSGGHNGIKSIIKCVGSDAFVHVRIGIGRPLAGQMVNAHVLSRFLPLHKEQVDAAIEYLLPALHCIVEQSPDQAMNKYNPRRNKKKKLREAENE